MLRYPLSKDQPKSAAANFALYLLGTQFRVDGVLYEVDDYGSFILNHPTTVDLYFPSKKAMNQW